MYVSKINFNNLFSYITHAQGSAYKNGQWMAGWLHDHLFVVEKKWFLEND